MRSCVTRAGSKGSNWEQCNQLGFLASKDQLQSKLYVKWLTWADAWSAHEVADGGDRLSESILRVGPREIKRVRRSKISPVEQVENFRPELQVELLANPEVFQYGKIHIFETRAVKLVAPQGAERT